MLLNLFIQENERRYCVRLWKLLLVEYYKKILEFQVSRIKKLATIRGEQFSRCRVIFLLKRYKYLQKKCNCFDRFYQSKLDSFEWLRVAGTVKSRWTTSLLALFIHNKFHTCSAWLSNRRENVTPPCCRNFPSFALFSLAFRYGIRFDVSRDIILASPAINPRR